MPTIYILKGLPGSGKSKWACEVLDVLGRHTKRVNKDLLREMLDNSNWSKANEKFVLQVRDSLILQAVTAGYDVIVDDTNLAPKHVERITALVDPARVHVKVVDRFLEVPLEECIKNDLKRSKSVGETVIRQMYRQFLAPRATYTPKASYPAIICDLDGTLALLNGRNPYDASTCENDAVNLPVQLIVSQWYAEGYGLILMSGRESRFRPQTEAWLKKNKIEYSRLLMRETGDSRKDAVVKKELFERFVDPDYDIKYVIDDRDQVVEMWRSLGLTCLQVNYGNF